MKKIVNGLLVEMTSDEIAEIVVQWSAKPTPEELKSQFNAEIDARLNAFSQERDWETIDRVLMQRGKFAYAAKIAQDAYDRTWDAAISLSPQVEAGTLTITDALVRLPALSWSA